MSNPYEIDPARYKYGERGDSIKALQAGLVRWGYEIAVDGIFGRDTKDAVERFEIDHGYHETLSLAVDLRTLVLLLGEAELQPAPPLGQPVGQPGGLLPQGKGMFLRNLTHAGSVADMKRTIEQRGLRWICVQRLWQYEDGRDIWYNSKSWRDYSRAWLETGCALWIWGWPVPSGIDRFVKAMKDTAASWGAVGIVIDAEKPWLGKKRDATHLVNEMRKLGLPLGLTSYGAPWSFKTFPFAELSAVDFGMPQIYDANDNMPSDYPERSVAEWQKLGYPRVVPVSSANKSPDRMRSLLACTPVPDGAITWWDWYNASQGKGRWDVIGQYELTTRGAARRSA